MAFRVTKRSAEQQARMQAGRDRARMDRPAPDYPPILPDLRRRIVIEDWDFGPMCSECKKKIAENMTTNNLLPPGKDE